MKKTISLILSVILMFTAAISATAESEKTLSGLCDALFDLLFDTDNVTLDGNAIFSLDGTLFKTAEARYIQDGDRSCWDLKLSSPKADGSIRENGYTVIADGSKIYVMEVYHPGVYKTGTGAPQSTILRESVQMDLMKVLIRSLAEQVEIAGESSAVSITENDAEQSVLIELNEPVPDRFTIALNVLAEFAAKRYFRTDYDQIGVQQMVPMNSYLTVTEGILSCMTSVSVKHAEAVIRKDGKGQIEQISGNASFRLNTAKDGERMLDLSFSLTVSDRGTSHVNSFDPATYGVKLAEGAMNIENIEYSEVDEHTQERLVEQAKEAWTQAGYQLDPSTFGYAYKQNGRYCTELNDNSYNLFLGCMTNVDGKILELRNTQDLWQEKPFNYEDPCPDPESAEEAAKKVMEYLEKVNPDAAGRIDRLKVECWHEEDNELYLEFCEDPIAQDWDGILVVVRVRPDWQIMYYSCFSNG